MANPSLQIGNDNWAIKEDNLLGYSTAGTRFVPQPITMTRATLGTRVNPSGLVEDVALLGSELVDCGNFECASPESVWGTGTGWSIANGLASYDGSGGTQSVNQAGVVESSKTYKLTLDVVSNEGSGINTIYLGGVIVSNIHLEVGNYIFFVTTSSTASLAVFGRSGENFVIDNISVKEATINNLARVDYTDGTSSLLVEPQRTNLYTDSNDTSTWTNSNFTTTNNYAISPDGTQNAFRGVSTSNASLLYISSTGSAGTNTISIYAKSNTDSDQKFRFFGNGNTTQSTDQTATQEWQRFDYTEAYSFVTWGLAGASVSETNDILFYGMQHEVGSYPTSYIKTSGSTVTRNQETYEKTGISDLINSTEGVLFVETEGLTDDLTTNELISISDGSTSNRLYLYRSSTDNKYAFAVFVGGALQVNIKSGVVDFTTNSKIAVKYKLNDFSLWVDGIEVATDTSGSVFSSGALNRLGFDDGDGAGNEFFGKVKQLQIFKTALTDTELATLTQ